MPPHEIEDDKGAEFGDAARPKKRARPKTTPAAAATEASRWPPTGEGPRRLAGTTLAFFGTFAIWPGYHGASPEAVARRHGARVVQVLDESVDAVVFGDLRGEGRADAKKRAERLARSGSLQIVSEGEYRDLVRIDLREKRFAFAGAFDCSPSGVADETLASLVRAVGATVKGAVDESVDYLVLGNRRGPGKIATRNKAEKLTAAGHPIVVLDEAAFLELVRIDRPLTADASAASGRPGTSGANAGASEFSAFLAQLHGHVDDKKLGRAMAMLRADRHQLFSSVDGERLVGVVKSQTDTESVYASFIQAGGRYGCAQPTLDDCRGLQGTPCKHLLVLLVGLVRAGELKAATAIDWVRGARGRRPRRELELCAETFVRYKGAEAGEIDWRPTETIPEDFYAV